MAKEHRHEWYMMGSSGKELIVIFFCKWCLEFKNVSYEYKK